MVNLLSAYGFRTESFSCAEDLLDSPCLTKSWCLVLDVQMPGISGLELQRNLAERQSHVPIIFISAHPHPQLREEAMRTGAIDFLSKPFSGQILLHAVRNALDQGKT